MCTGEESLRKLPKCILHVSSGLYLTFLDTVKSGGYAYVSPRDGLNLEL